MAVNTSIGLIGVAKQSAKGTPANAPAFVHGLTGGQVFKLDRTVANADVSCGIRTSTDSYVESATPGADFDTYGYSDALPLYFLAAMGALATTSQSTLYKHIITMGAALPYLTVWGQIGQDITRLGSAKVDQLEMEFSGNAPLSFGITALGLDALFGISQMPGSITPSCFDGYFVPTGGTFKLETAGGTPVEAPVTAGALTLANGVTASTYAGAVLPGDVSEGKLTVSGSVTVRPDDMALYRKMVTGAANGTDITASMVYGSFEWEFRHSVETGHTMKVIAPRVPFTADFPSVDPQGGAAEMQFSFDNVGVASAAGSPVTVEFVNSTASYA